MDRHAGTLLRHWRSLRRLSQLDVSNRTGVSTRHLSCVETGRAKPSRELLLYLADEFEMPQRAVNDMLLAAGFAPVFSEYALDDAAMVAARDVIQLVLDGNDPNPTTVIDIRWNLVDANSAAFWFTAGVDPSLLTAPLNVARLSLHPDGLAGQVTNFDEYAGQLLRHMRHVLVLTQDEQLRALIDECETYAPTAARSIPTAPEVVLPLRIVIDGVELSFLSTVTTFGAARDVTLSELSIETLYPADQITREILGKRPWIDRAPDLSAVV
jgi:transcriptional regulator with XRE-family HTH domain